MQSWASVLKEMWSVKLHSSVASTIRETEAEGFGSNPSFLVASPRKRAKFLSHLNPSYRILLELRIPSTYSVCLKSCKYYAISINQTLVSFTFLLSPNSLSQKWITKDYFFFRFFDACGCRNPTKSEWCWHCTLNCFIQKLPCQRLRRRRHNSEWIHSETTYHQSLSW